MTKDKHKLQNIGRLAMRAEGENWVAYYAQKHTMEGAVWLGSVRLSFVQSNDQKLAFLAFIKSVLKANLRQELTWGGIHDAPEHEKAGRA